ncbi:MAG: hypothetical protein WA755_05790 [Candidatus Acidiferrales bacterium]
MDVDSFAELFSLLPVTENPKQASFDGIPLILHEDHRWLLPIAFLAQQKGLLPRPCTVIMFDRHHDALDPSRDALDQLKRLRVKPNPPEVVSLCAEKLKKNDDDWLKAGMEIGIFGDAVILGVHDDFEAEKYRFYRDHLGQQHAIEMTALPGSGLAHQGQLSDLARRKDLGALWKVLGWGIIEKRFRFLPDVPKTLLTIDLDCFAIEWRDYTFAWPNKIFESEFLKPSGDWTGRSFLQELARKSGLVGIARETGCCGGPGDAEIILENLVRYGFEDRFSF